VKFLTPSLASISARCEPMAPTPTMASGWRLMACWSMIEALRRGSAPQTFRQAHVYPSPHHFENPSIELELLSLLWRRLAPEVSFKDIRRSTLPLSPSDTFARVFQPRLPNLYR
jgi:hypothetical protein